MTTGQTAKSKVFKVLLIAIVLILMSGIGVGYVIYQKIFSGNVSLDKDTAYLFIPTGSTSEDVFKLLYDNDYIVDHTSFELIAAKKNYSKHVNPGRFLLSNRMSNNDLVNLLRSGKQTPIQVTFNNIRTKAELSGKISKLIEADSVSIIKLLNNKKYTESLGFDPLTIISLFLPNTYEFYWNTSAKELITRMHDEYKKFWTKERIEQAKKINLSKVEVSTLASIVQAEQSTHNSEKSTIAGLYINRIKKGMLLQSDPTVIYAIGDFSIRRVLNADKEFDSPFNTYKYTGLPPAPINLPEISSIDAVLNYKTHKYIYMCAKEDFSGYHNFAKTYSQHIKYAKKYHRALNKKKIMR